MPKLLDTHTHFNFNSFKDDCDEVIKNTLSKDVWFINVGAEKRTSLRAVKIAKKYPKGVYASVGLHPIHIYESTLDEEIKGEKVSFRTTMEKYDKEYYKKLLEEKKVVAVGETGLDYFHIKQFKSDLNKKLKDKQKEVFSQQIDLAGENDIPLIIHARSEKGFDAHLDILKILKEKKKTFPNLTGVVHCYSGDAIISKEYLSLGFLLGFNGIITFAADYDEIIRETDISKILIETDSPWLTPVPYRGKRNQSIYVEEVAKRIGVLKEMEYKEVAETTTNNATKLFNIS